MNYLCLIYYDEQHVETMTDEQWHALVERCLACGERLRASGHMLAGEPLQSVRTARTVRVRDGAASVVDGPFAETREQLAGFYLIQAEDADEAAEIAATLPPAAFGSIEVRPLRQLPQR
ncbi:YciI family protein [Stutzerimonas chloritidismutans]|uniref:YciI family protein n=1 Tax=Stutzerimonas chloritidismutans TaxID=203192 RepID=UPI003F141867